MSLSLLVVLQLGCTQQKENMNHEVQSAQPLTIETIAAIKSKPDKTLEKMSQLIKLDCEQDKQCKTIGVGVSPCGGSPKHLVYSTKSSYVTKLIKMVQSYNKHQNVSKRVWWELVDLFLRPKHFALSKRIPA